MARSRSSYPLAGSSRSRRRLLMNHSGESTESHLEENPQESPDQDESEDLSIAGEDREPLIIVTSQMPEDVQGQASLASRRPRVSQLDSREMELMELKEQLATREHLLSLKEKELDKREQNLLLETSRLQYLKEVMRQKSPQSNQEMPGASLLEEVQALLQGNSPVTWVFTGENPIHSSHSSRTRRTYIEQFSDRVRGEMARTTDVVIDTAASGQSTRQLLTDFSLRALRFSPDVVSVMVSPFDCKEGKKGQREFQKLIRDLVEQSREHEFRLILQTPNRLDLSVATDCQALRSYIRILRETTAEHDLPLIDHWAYWKKKCPDESQLRQLLESNGIFPNTAGHRALARLLFATLRMNDQAPTPEHSGIGLEYCQ